MDIVFICDNFPPEVGAAASRVYERACYWVRWGHRVTVITSAPNAPEGRVYPGYKNRWYSVEDRDGIRVVRVKTFVAPNKGVVLRTLDFMSFMMTAFVAGLFQRRPDVIAATTPQFFAAVGSWALAETRRLPFVLELSDLWPASISAVGALRRGRALQAVEKLELFLYRRAAAVVALTRAFKDDLVKRGIAGEKIAVVRNGVDGSRFKPVPKDPELARQLGLEIRFVVGYIGTHGMAHALENVLDAAALLERECPRASFLFVGSGAERERLVAEAKRRRLTNVVFVPRQPKEAIPHYWGLCDVSLVHLKKAQLFTTVIPSKIFEAMGMGLPLLFAGPDGEAAQIIRDNQCGLTVPPEEPEALAAEVARLCEDGSLCAKLAKNALLAAPNFSREKQAAEMLRVLQASARPPRVQKRPFPVRHTV